MGSPFVSGTRRSFADNVYGAWRPGPFWGTQRERTWQKKTSEGPKYPGCLGTCAADFGGAKPLPEVRGLAPQSRRPTTGPIQPAGRGSYYTQLHFCAAKETTKPVRIGACVLYTTSLRSIELSQALRSSGIIGVSGKPDEDLESRFSSCARAICVFTCLSTAPAVASQRAKPRKTPFIRHVYIPAFMILTNPPSRSAVQDDVLRGVPLQEMLPRKGIAT